MSDRVGTRPGGLALRDLAVGYPPRGWGRRTPRTVLSGLRAHARPGELTMLLGPNGVGKSTLLRTLCGLQRPLAGQVCLDGTDLRTMDRVRLARSLAVVLTERVDVALLTVRELVALGRHPYTPITGRLTEADADVVVRALETVGAGHLADRRFSEISDGERQRVMIARALAQQPEVVLLDEPTAFLDVSGRTAITALLGRLAHEEGLTVVASTHELNLALQVADVLWLIDRRGRLYVGTPDEMTRSPILAHALDLTGRDLAESAQRPTSARSRPRDVGG